MDIKGFSRYDFSCDTDGDVVVVNKKTGKRLAPAKMRTVERSGAIRYYLCSDDKKRGTFTVNKLKWLIKHPGVPIPDLRGQRVTFDDNGNAINCRPPSKQYRVFRSIDDAFETLNLISNYQTGEVAPLMKFINQSEEPAINTVKKMVCLNADTCREYWDDAVSQFLKELEMFNVTRIMPLFAWLCKCLRTTILAERGKRYALRENGSTHAQR